MAKGTRTDAELRYAKAQKRVEEAAKAQTEVQAEARRVTEKTARLKALRLAKEAADQAEAAAAPPAAKKAKAKPRAKALTPKIVGTISTAPLPAASGCAR